MQSKITHKYVIHSQTRIFQGDILRDIKFKYIDNTNEATEISLSYSVIVSQDCDLERIAAFNPILNETTEFNQYLPNVLLIPAFPAELVKDGTYLINLFNTFFK